MAHSAKIGQTDNVPINSWLWVCLFIILTSQLVACARLKPIVPPSFESIPSTPRLLPSRVVPGQVTVVLDKSLWKETFTVSKEHGGPQGIERLKISPELAKIFKRYQLLIVQRAYPQLEQRTDGTIQVVSYAQWVEKRKEKRGTRKNARPYKAPELPEMGGTFDLKFPGNTNLKALLEELRKIPDVILAEMIMEPEFDVPFYPNDPGWVDPSNPNFNSFLAGGRWGFHNTGAELGQGYLVNFDIDAPEAWEWQQGYPSTVVAVLDDGVDVAHPDLYLNIYLNNGEVPAAIVNTYKNASSVDGLPNELTFFDLNEPAVVAALNAPGCTTKTDAVGQPCVDTNDNGYIDGEDVTNWWSDDIDGSEANEFIDDLVGWNFNSFPYDNKPFGENKGEHGTAVAGLIAAIANNATAIAGVANHTRVLPVRARANHRGLVYALDFPSVKVINQSQRGKFTSSGEHYNHSILQTLEPEGVLYIASLGNFGWFDYGGDPARREEVMAISDFFLNGTRSLTSSYGPKTDVAAPGKGLHSLRAMGGTGPFGGTSAAAPMVAGVAALIASENDTLTPEQIRQVLRMTAHDPAAVAGDRGENTTGWDIYSGWGMVSAENALDSVRNGTVYPEANILSLPVNYVNDYRHEHFSIRSGTVDLYAYLGLPDGALVDWNLRRSRHWDLSGAVQETAITAATYSDGSAPIFTLDTDNLEAGRHVLELEVSTASNVVAKDRAIIDLPRAYIENLKHHEYIIDGITLRGFAYGPGFTQYVVDIAPGWSPAAGDFVELHTSTTEKSPDILEYYILRPLVSAHDLTAEIALDSLPFTGEATIRITTFGNATWAFEEQVYIDDSQQAGFPIAGFSAFAAAPVASDLNNDGVRELILVGMDYYQPSTIKVFQADGTPLTGTHWPVTLPTGELIFQAPAVGDVDGDGLPELVVRSHHPDEKIVHIRLFNHDGSEVTNGWPITFNDNYASNYYPTATRTPVLADVSQDGRLDILVTQPADYPDEPQPVIRAYESEGTIIRTYQVPGSASTISQPAVGDIDGDGENELVAITRGYSDMMYVWELDGSVAWSHTIRDSSLPRMGPVYDPPPPILIDIDNDKLLEVVATSCWGFVMTFDDDGTILSQSEPRAFNNKLIASQLRPSAAPGEMAVIHAFHDGPSYTAQPPSGRDYGVYMFARNPNSGEAMPGWDNPLRITDASTHNNVFPLVADITGDEKLEIAFTNSWVDSYNYTGADPHWTLSLASFDGNLVTESYLWPFEFPWYVTATPLVTDLDGDGDLEVVAHYRLTSDQTKNNLLVFDLAQAAGPGRIAWGELAHDPKRSSNYHGDLHVLSPSTAHPAHVGLTDDPSASSLLELVVHFSRGTPVMSTDPHRWTVMIGNIEAQVVNVSVIQGEHRIQVDAGVQPLGEYSLRVEYNDGGLLTWDSYRNAVQYLSPAHSVALLFDTSGSMSCDFAGMTCYGVPVEHQRLTLAKQAVMPFLDLLNDFNSGNANFSIATFPAHPSTGCTAEVVAPMMLVTDNSIAEAQSQTIPTLTTENATPLLAGLAATAGLFGVEANKAIVLLSDGYHNCPHPVGNNDVAVLDLIDDLKSQSIKTYTIGFGSPADINHPLLESLAGETFGQFYDVTAEDFSLPWDPALALHETYKSILIDALGLQAPEDPRGLIEGQDKKQFTVNISKYEKKVSFYLSWVTPQKDRLNLTIISSDGKTVPITNSGVRYHSGDTYKIFTVDKSFLHRPGKVGVASWKIKIDADDIEQDDQENFQYSVIVDSALKLTPYITKRTIGTGDAIKVAARITEAGRPVRNLHQVRVKITKPAEGIGNWLSRHSINKQDYKSYTKKRQGEQRASKHDKANYIRDVIKAPFPGRAKPEYLSLYDDGSHGDIRANDGIYTNLFVDTNKEGTYKLFFEIQGKTRKGNSFTRYHNIHKYVAVQVQPQSILLDYEHKSIAQDNIKKTDIIITPKDSYGNYLGPGYVQDIHVTIARGKLVSPLKDNLDGTYTQTVQYPVTLDIRQLGLIVDVRGSQIMMR